MARRFWGDRGGILDLVDLIDQHRSAFAYDWRVRFGLPLDSIGEAIDWREAYDLAKELMLDTTSHANVAVTGMRTPWSPEAWLLADVWDLLSQVYSKRGNHRPHFRPSDGPKPQSRFGGTTLPQAKVRDLLEKRGPRKG